MEPLPTTHQCLIWLRICPADESSSRWQKLLHIIFAMIALSVLICTCISSLTFGLKFISIDVAKSLFAFMIVTSEFTVIYMALVGMFLLRHKIDAIFKDLSKIYDECGMCSLFSLYWNRYSFDSFKINSTLELNWTKYYLNSFISKHFNA